MKLDKQDTQSSKCVYSFFKNIYNKEVKLVNPDMDQVIDKIKSIGIDFPMLFLLYTADNSDIRQLISEVAGSHIYNNYGRYVIFTLVNDNLHIYYLRRFITNKRNGMEIWDNNTYFLIQEKEFENYNIGNVVGVCKLIRNE